MDVVLVVVALVGVVEVFDITLRVTDEFEV